MKKQLIFLFSTLLMISIVSNNQKNNQEILNETTTIKNNDTKIKLLQNNQENTVNDYQCSKIFTQYGKDADNEYLRFAIAIKGDVSSVKYTRVISSIDNQVEPIKMFSVNCLYNGIKNGDETSYYNDNGELVSEKTDYYWACYTIKFNNDSLYKKENISVFVSINGEEKSANAKSLELAKEERGKTLIVDSKYKWNGKDCSTSLTGKGTETNPYLIDSPSDMAFFAKDVKEGNNYLNKFVKLNCDLDMSNPNFTGIGDGDLVNGKWSTKEFKGNFDGDNHDVKLCVYKSYMAGMFNASSGTIKNVTTSGIVYTQNRVAGGVVGYLNGGTVENVTNNATVLGKHYIDGKGHIGGVVGFLKKGEVINSINNGSIFGSVTNFGDNQGVGGVIGTVEKGVTALDNLTNNGYVYNRGYNTGGVIGLLRRGENFKTSKLYNHGIVIGKTNTGGVIGVLNYSNTTIDDVHNYGDIKGTNYVGGVIGALGYDGNRTSTLSNSTNDGKVEATLEVSKGGYRCGGIAGMAYGSTVNKCVNNGEVIVKYKENEEEKIVVPSDQYDDSLKTKYVGYIVGYKTGQGKVEECTNNFGK